MLTFIVLGIIPGTNLQINFSWLISGLYIAAIIVLLVADARYVRGRLAHRLPRPEDIAI